MEPSSSSDRQFDLDLVGDDDIGLVTKRQEAPPICVPIEEILNQKHDEARTVDEECWMVGAKYYRLNGELVPAPELQRLLQEDILRARTPSVNEVAWGHPDSKREEFSVQDSIVNGVLQQAMEDFRYLLQLYTGEESWSPKDPESKIDRILDCLCSVAWLVEDDLDKIPDTLMLEELCKFEGIDPQGLRFNARKFVYRQLSKPAFTTWMLGLPHWRAIPKADRYLHVIREHGVVAKRSMAS